MNTIAPDIFRKRLLIEGFYTIEITKQVIIDYFSFITMHLSLRTYGEPIVHTTAGSGKEVNEGYDFDEELALQKTNEFFHFTEHSHKLF